MRAVAVFRRCAAGVVLAAVVPIAASAQTSTPIVRLSMEDAIRLALARNQALLAQRLTFDASKADEITAALKPNIGIAMSAAAFTPFSPRQSNWDFLKNQ